MEEAQCKQLDELLTWFKQHKRVAVAFSGGTDSTLLLAVAQRALGNDAVAFTAQIEAQPKSDLQFTRNFCEHLHIQQVVFTLGERGLPGFASNPPERCYLCKRAIYERICELANERSIECIVDGTNLDDLGENRPGRRALQETGIATPFVDCGLTKADVRALSHALNLPTWDKPSNSCLYTRLAFGETITDEKLERIRLAEASLAPLDLKRVRARLQDDHLTLEIEP